MIADEDIMQIDPMSNQMKLEKDIQYLQFSNQEKLYHLNAKKLSTNHNIFYHINGI